MSIAYRVQDYIAEQALAWDPIVHPASQSSREAARLAHVPSERLAKAVLLEDSFGYVLAVTAADHRIDLREVGAVLRRELRLAGESALRTLFSDCAYGAVPPVGAAYGIPTVWDARLGEQPEVYFEGGDHRTLVHMSGADFCELMRSARTLESGPH